MGVRTSDGSDVRNQIGLVLDFLEISAVEKLVYELGQMNKLSFILCQIFSTPLWWVFL